MIVFFNLKGLAVFFAALLVALVALFTVPGLNGPPFHVLFGALIAAIDLAYRYKWVRPRLAALPASQRGRANWDVDFSRIWWISNHGGNLMLLPAWVIGIIFPPVLFWIARQ